MVWTVPHHAQANPIQERLSPPSIEDSISPSDSVSGSVEGIDSLEELSADNAAEYGDWYEISVDGPGTLVIEDDSQATVIGNVISDTGSNELFVEEGSGLGNGVDNAYRATKAGTYYVQIATIEGTQYSVNFDFRSADDDSDDGADDTPTDEPTDTPTDEPTDTPTDEPTDTPTDEPTDTPTDEPTDTPTDEPTDTPTDEPTDTPTDEPTDTPTDEPTDTPTDEPTDTPTDEPTDTPTDEPTDDDSDDESADDDSDGAGDDSDDTTDDGSDDAADDTESDDDSSDEEAPC